MGVLLIRNNRSYCIPDALIIYPHCFINNCFFWNIIRLLQLLLVFVSEEAQKFQNGKVIIYPKKYLMCHACFIDKNSTNLIIFFSNQFMNDDLLNYVSIVNLSN